MINHAIWLLAIICPINTQIQTEQPLLRENKRVTTAIFRNKSRHNLFLQHETGIWLIESCCRIISHTCANAFSAIHKTVHNDDFIGVSFLSRDMIIYLLLVLPCCTWTVCVCVCGHACMRVSVPIYIMSSGLFGNYFHFSYSNELLVKHNLSWLCRMGDDSDLKG